MNGMSNKYEKILCFSFPSDSGKWKTVGWSCLTHPFIPLRLILGVT